VKRRTALKMVALSALTPEIPALIAGESQTETKLPSNIRASASNADVLASIRLYNPTHWTHPTIVEVPAGRLAAPGQINWREVRLLHKGWDLPFSLREGRAHWRANLTPVSDPRAEDLIVFTVTVPHGTWSQVDLVGGPRKETSALTQRGNQLIISYPDVKVVINQATAMLHEIEALGVGLLDAPMTMNFFHVQGGVIESSELSPLSYSHPKVMLEKAQPAGSPRAKLVSCFSDAAFSELNFVLNPGRGPAMALTYRVHPGGLVEIWSDERPWESISPWLNYGVKYTLGVKGEIRRLPRLETPYPFYGFKDYDSVVKNIGILHREKRVALLEVGEESINGRRWNRRLYTVRQDQLAQLHDLLELIDEGLVIEVAPKSLCLDSRPLRILYPHGCKAIATVLEQALKKARFHVESASGLQEHQKRAIILKILKRPAEVGLEGDGFAIQPLQDGSGASIVSGTRFGLMMGTLKLADHVRKIKDTLSLPLVASNPAVGLRAAGFGGGPIEVDFPYGNDGEWTKVFDDLIASGINTMTCLGMWSNWKMPVTFKYMPELKSASPGAYDPVSGAKFSEFISCREHGLKLLNYLHERGVKVWLWVPVGAIPTTFAEKFPDAVLPGNPKVPLVMHPKYRQYLHAFFKEILETYPLDGFVLIRDDNGGIDTSEEFENFVAASRTKDPMWEQHLIICDLLQATGFRGDLAVYPYHDFYKPRLEPFLPKDLFIVGHGSGFGTLTRNYKFLGPMGHTWLDNLYAGFRLPPASRMKRLISDRGSYWIGGAFRGTELPWESIGYFTWEPNVTVNTLRYYWGIRTFGEKSALCFLQFSSAYEQLWNLMNVSLLPYSWLRMSPQSKNRVEQECNERLELYRKRLAELHSTAGKEANADWFAQVNLYGTFFEYCRRRLQLFGDLYSTVLLYKGAMGASKPLPGDVRRRVISIYREMLEAADPYAEQIRTVPGAMMRATESSTRPYKESAVSGYGPPLDKMLELQEFAGKLTVSYQDIRAGRPFMLTVELFNTGICPWVPNESHKLELASTAQLLRLPLSWDLSGDWVLPGDRRVVKLSGTAPAEPGAAEIEMKFWSPSGAQSHPFIDHELRLKWE